MQTIIHVDPKFARDYSLSAIKNTLSLSPTNSVAEDGNASLYDKLRLYLHQGHGGLRARVEVLHPQSITVEEERAANDLNNGLDTHATPPEIMMEEKPTEQETCRLFRLCEEQALCFRIINRTLEAEKAGRQVDQLRMCIMGQAGTGKSEIMTSVIWHSFQHEMNRLIGSSAYQWKAALLNRTAHTQSVSSCSFYGVDKFHPHRTPGISESSQKYFNTDVRLLYTDEFGTLSLSFVVVSSSGSENKFSSILLLHF